ncbi:MAG: hypothetical protein IJD16_04690 [Desulfovibrio sp.]|nr:hypothetical protein [Desulfovibrio sp.]
MTQEDLIREAEECARAAGLPLGEYLAACQQSMQAFVERAPHILNDMLSTHSDVHKANAALEQKISLGCRRTYGSF